MIHVIGLAGPAHSGKTTLAGYLQDELLDFHVYHLADPLKAAVNAMFGWSHEHSHGKLKDVVDPLVGISPRTAYQRFGTEFGRNHLHDLFPELVFPRGEAWLRRAHRELDDLGSLIIPDVRYEDEATWVREQGGVIVHVRRDGVFGLKDENNKLHSSEAGIVVRSGGNDLIPRVCSTLGELRVESHKIIDAVRGYRL